MGPKPQETVNLVIFTAEKKKINLKIRGYEIFPSGMRI